MWFPPWNQLLICCFLRQRKWIVYGDAAGCGGRPLWTHRCGTRFRQNIRKWKKMLYFQTFCLCFLPFSLLLISWFLQSPTPFTSLSPNLCPSFTCRFFLSVLSFVLSFFLTCVLPFFLSCILTNSLNFLFHLSFLQSLHPFFLFFPSIFYVIFPSSLFPVLPIFPYLLVLHSLLPLLPSLTCFLSFLPGLGIQGNWVFLLDKM